MATKVAREEVVIAAPAYVIVSCPGSSYDVRTERYRLGRLVYTDRWTRKRFTAKVVMLRGQADCQGGTRKCGPGHCQLLGAEFGAK